MLGKFHHVFLSLAFHIAVICPIDIRSALHSTSKDGIYNDYQFHIQALIKARDCDGK